MSLFFLIFFFPGHSDVVMACVRQCLRQTLSGISLSSLCLANKLIINLESELLAMDVKIVITSCNVPSPSRPHLFRLK